MKQQLRIQRQRFIPPPIPLLLGLGLLFGNNQGPTVQAFPFIPPQTSTFNQRNTILLYDNGERSIEADCIQTIKSSRTFPQLQQALLNYRRTNYPGETKLQEQVLSPNLAAAALRKASSLPSTKAMTDLVPKLLQVIGNALRNNNNNNTTATIGTLSLYGLTDTLTALTLLVNQQKRQREYFTALALNIWETMATYGNNTTQTLGTKRWVECLQAAQLFELHEHALYTDIATRLVQGDALAQLSTRDATTLLYIIQLSSGQERIVETTLLKAVARRLRQQSIRETMSTRQIVKVMIPAARMIRDHDECRKLVYTLAKEVVLRNEKNHSHKENNITPAELLQVAESVQQLNLETDSWLLQHLVVQLHRAVGDPWTVDELARLVKTLEQSTAVDDDIAPILQSIGEQFLRAVKQSEKSMNPQTVNSLLRSVVLRAGRQPDVMEPFVDASRHLFLDEAFLAKCQVMELSNFVWFMWMLRMKDTSVLISLARRILRPDIVEECHPKLACRMLRTFTTLLVSDDDDDDQMSEEEEKILVDLFDQLGEHLLSSQLTIVDITSAIYAYAKANYAQDMGIFDHLLGLLADQYYDCNDRQLAQSLWSCGKMVAWESDLDDETPPPPYMESAARLAECLSSRAKHLTTKDVSQTIWAMARLKLDDPTILGPLAKRAALLSQDLTMHEIANILWALSRLKTQCLNLVFVLTRRLMIDDALLIKPQEASNVMLSLGRMNIREEELFRKMSNAILNDIKNASAQSIANALWAHRTVHMTPPQALIDTWARERLGLISLQAPKKGSDNFNQYDL